MANRKIIGTALISVLLTAGIAVPAFAADSMSGNTSGEMTKDSGVPATEAQAEQLKNVPDDAAGAATEEQGMEAGGMPATKAQKQQLKETPKMSSDKAETPDTDD